MKLKNAAKAVLFVLIFAVLFLYANRLVTISSSDEEYQWMTGIYEEEPGSLDAVYFGSSKAYAFWNPNTAWEQYGINVFTYTCSSQPLIAMEYLLKEVRKTQPDSVYVININTMGDGRVRDEPMHRLFDFMPLSKNKLEFMDYIMDLRDLSFFERLEYYFPIIRFHSRITSLEEGNFVSEYTDTNGADVKDIHLEGVYDNSENYCPTDERAEITDALEDSINSLLDYCEEENLRVVFAAVPSAEDSDDWPRINTICDLIEGRGFDVINVLENPELAHIDLTSDYYNPGHTNVHGSIKYTDYVARYLIDKYGFEDKRGDERYESWDEALENYNKKTAPYVLDFETDVSHRDFSMAAPDKFGIAAEKESNSLYWQPVRGADGYVVYKKTDGREWTAIADVTDDTKAVDEDVSEDHTYTYTVVAYYVRNGERYYGNYSYKGITTNY